MINYDGDERFYPARMRRPTPPYTAASVPIDNNAFGDSVYYEYKAFIETFGPIFEAYEKPLRFAMLILGIDSNDGALYLARNPGDGGVPEGDSPPTGAPITGRSVFFHFQGRHQVGLIMTAWAKALQVRLTEAGYQSPEMIVSDFESISDVVRTAYRENSIPINDVERDTWYFRRQGWYEAFDGRELNAPAFAFSPAPVYAQYMLDDGRSLATYIATRQQTIVGTPFTHDYSTTTLDPANHYSTQLATVALDMSYRRSLGEAVFGPLKDVFGPRLLTGEWNSLTSSVDYAYRGKPGPYWNYLHEGAFGGPASAPGPSTLGPDVQIPVNYGNGGGVFDRDDTDLPLPWSTVTTWKYFYGLDGEFLANDLTAFRFIWDKVRAGTLSRPDRPLFPCVGLDGYLKSAHYTESPENTAALQSMFVRYMYSCTVYGAVGFWIYAPDLNNGFTTGPRDNPPNYTMSPETYRAQYTNLLDAYQKAVRAGRVKRNRVCRGRRAG